MSLLVAVFLVATIGKLTHAFELEGWLGLSGPQFWTGQIWRLETYALVPAGILDFVMNALALVLLGGLLERHLKRGEFWLACLVATAGGGCAKVLLQSSNPSLLVGAAPTMFGLLIAWGFLCGRERIQLVPFGEITVWKLVLTAGAISLLVTFFTTGPAAGIILSAGGAASWLYFWLKQKWLMSRASSLAHSERIRRLEL